MGALPLIIDTYTMRVDVFHDNKGRENCFGLGVALCGSPRRSTSVHESEAAVIPVAKSVCDLWPTRSEEGRRCCVFCSTLRNCGHSSHARQGNRNLQTMVQLFTCYMVCRLSQCLLKEDAWPPGHLTTWPPGNLATWQPGHLATWPAAKWS